jgi:hypothetical protein
MRRLPMLLLLAACSDYQIYTPDEPKPLDPPDDEVDIWGEPPGNFEDCYEGFVGIYGNLPSDHPDVEVEPLPEGERPALGDLDWWDGSYTAFTRYDASIDWGANWWPVDSGLADDPRYFSARWLGWMRVFRRGTFTFVLGGQQDAWLIIDDEVVATVREADELEVLQVPFELTAGIKRVEVRYAHRRGDASGFRFRLDHDDTVICYPEYHDED